MATNLFIGSIAYAVTDDDLKAHFESVGAVKSAKVIMDRDTGRSKGFGFVEMETDEDAAKCKKPLLSKRFFCLLQNLLNSYKYFVPIIGITKFWVEGGS